MYEIIGTRINPQEWTLRRHTGTRRYMHDSQTLKMTRQVEARARRADADLC